MSIVQLSDMVVHSECRTIPAVWNPEPGEDEGWLAAGRESGRDRCVHTSGVEFSSVVWGIAGGGRGSRGDEKPCKLIPVEIGVTLALENDWKALIDKREIEART